jgi:hypothetical protein
MTRLEELRRAEEKLTRLVQAAVEVCNDITATEMIRETATAHGPASALDIEYRAIIALARAKAGIEVESRRITKSNPKGNTHV